MLPRQYPHLPRGDFLQQQSGFLFFQPPPIRHLLTFSRPWARITGRTDTKINKDWGQGGTPISWELLDLDLHSKQAFPWDQEFLMAFKFKQLCGSSPSAHTRDLAPNSGISQVKFLLHRRFGWSQGRSLAKSELRSSEESSRTTTPSAGSLCYIHESLRVFSYQKIGAHCKLPVSLRLVRSYHNVGRFGGARVSNQD